jgi:hypothetical protein
MERRRGPRTPSAGQGKGMRASPTCGGVAQLKVAAVEQGRGPGGGGIIHHSGGGVGRQLHEAV